MQFFICSRSSRFRLCYRRLFLSEFLCIIKSNYLWFIQNILLLLLLLFYAIHLTESCTCIKHAALTLKMPLTMFRLARLCMLLLLSRDIFRSIVIRTNAACLTCIVLTSLGMHLKTFLNCTWYNKLYNYAVNKLESSWKHMWKDKCTNKWQNRDNIQLWICTIHIYSITFSIRTRWHFVFVRCRKFVRFKARPVRSQDDREIEKSVSLTAILLN